MGLAKRSALSAAVLVCTVPAWADTANQIEELGFSHAGHSRDFLLHTPEDIGEAAAPLVLVFHGGWSSSREFVAATHGRWNMLADEHGFLVAYPNALKGQWSFGGVIPAHLHAQPVDDLDYFRALIDEVDSRTPIDRERIFATGFSRGGMASYYLGCWQDGLLRAIAPVAMTLPAEFEPACTSGAPMGLALMMGTDDPSVPFEGGWMIKSGRKAYEVVSAERTLEIFRGRNGCASTATGEAIHDDRWDGTSVTHTTWTDCTGAPVIDYRIERGGHTWPSGEQYQPRRIIGATTREINAADAAWRFFAGFD